MLRTLTLRLAAPLAALIGLGIGGCTDQAFTVDVPLRVVSTSPSDGAAGVIREQQLRVTFSEPLDPATVTADAFVLEALGGALGSEEAPAVVECEVAYAGGEDNGVVLTPAALLPYSTDLRLRVSTAVLRERDGGPLPVPVSARFATLDPPALRVADLQPANGSIGVARDSGLRVTFSEPPDCASLNAGANVEEALDLHPRLAGETSPRTVAGSWSCPPAGFEPEDPAGAVSCAGDPSPCTATFAFDEADHLFEYSSHVTLTLQGGVIESTRATDRGGQLSETVVATSRVTDPPPLFVSGIEPGDGTSGFPLDGVIAIRFSEPPALALAADCTGRSADPAALIGIVETLDGHPRFDGLASPETVAGTYACVVPPAGAPEGSAACTDDPATDPCTIHFTADTPFEHSSAVAIVVQGVTLEPGVAPASIDGVESLRATTYGGQVPADVTSEARAEDPPPLRVVASAPASGAEQIALGAVLEVTFTEPVRCESIDGHFTLIEQLDSHPTYGGGQIDHTAGATVGCIDGSSTVTFAPAQAFAHSSVIELELSGAAHPDALESARATTLGGQLPESVTLTFRAEDPPALGLIASRPASGSEGAALDGTLEVTFTEPVLCDSLLGHFTLTEALDGHPHYGPGTIDHTADVTVLCTETDPVVVFVPANAFQHSSQVTLSLSGGLYPAAVESARASTLGGQLPSDVAISFRAMDPPALLVSGASPAPGSIRVATGADVTVTFSEDVACASVTATSFTVTETTDAGAQIAHTCAFSCAGPDVTCDPAQDFGLSSSIEVALSTEIESARASSRGGQLPSPFVYGFQTTDPPPLLVVSTQPGDGNDNVRPEALVTVVFSEAVDCGSITAGTFLVESRDPDDATSPFAPVPGTFACTADDPTVTFDADPDYAYDAQVRVSLTTAIASAQATTGGGQLAQPVTFTFDIIPVPPIEIVTTRPIDEQQNLPPTTQLEIVFNQDVLESTLCTEPSATCTDPNVWIVVDGDGIAARLPMTLVSYDAGTRTAVFDPTGDLPIGSRFEVSVRGGLAGVRTQQGAILLADYRWQFSTGANVFVVSTTPRADATDVPVSTEICVTFTSDVDTTTVDASSFAVTFVDDLGQTVVVPADATAAAPDGYTFEGVNPSTGEPDAAFTSNRVCIVVDPTLYGCLLDQATLLYDATYTVTLAEAIAFTEGNVLTGGYAWSFTTGTPPQIAGIHAENFLVTIDPLRDATDVPVNSELVVTFAEPMDPGSVSATTLVLTDALGAPVPASVVLSTSGLEARLLPDALLAYDTAHTLTLASGLSGLLTAGGEYLPADIERTFVTSPATLVEVSPPQPRVDIPNDIIKQSSLVAVTFSRPMYLPSLNTTTIFATLADTGSVLSGIVALDVADPDAAILDVVPTFPLGSNVIFHVTTGAMDLRGNPIPSEVTVRHDTVQNAPAFNARAPDLIAASALQPNTGPVQGDQTFTLTLPVPGPQLANRFLPPTFSNDTLVVRDVDGCHGTAGAVVGQSNVFDVGAPGAPDVVTFRAAGRLLSGCSYEITLVQNGWANIYTASNGGADIVVTVSGEVTPPTLLTLAPDPAAPIAADSALVLTFDENLEPSSVTPTTVELTDVSGTAVATSIFLEGAVLTVRPLAPLAASAGPYTLTLAGVTDVAGNAATVAAQVYTIETVPPQVTAVTVPGAADDPIVIAFSETINPATLTRDTLSADGSVRLRVTATGDKVLGCLSIAEDGLSLVFQPLEPLVTGTEYDVTVTTAVTDLGGTAVAADHVETFTAP